MPNKLFWVPIPVTRWLTDLAGGLLPEQKGALLDLAATAWEQTPPCTLPNDARYLASRSGLGAQWPRLSPAILAQFEPTEDGRLMLTWLKEIYDHQLQLYENKKKRNKAWRDRQPETSQKTPPKTSRKTSRKTSHETSHNGARDASEDVSEDGFASRAENLELRRSLESSNELSKAPAPEARASAGEARAAPGARDGESIAAPSDDSDSGRAVDSRRGGGPETIADVMQHLRPPGAVIRPSVAKERELALDWAREHPDEATRVELELHDDVLWPKAKPKQRQSMLVSAFVKAMHASAVNSAEKHDRDPEHVGVTP